MTEIIYRLATSGDSDLVYRIKTRSVKPYVTAVYGWDEDFQISFHQKSFKPGNAWLLSLNEVIPEFQVMEPFGFVEIEYRETGIFLANILIDEAFQGRGLGTAVMHRLIREANGPVRRPIRLEVFRINKRAREFYKRLGFRVIGRDRIKLVMERK